MHLTHFDQRLAEAELAKAAAFVDQVAGGQTPSLLGGDLNIHGSATAFASLRTTGYTPPETGIDHLLGRGMRLVRGPAPLDERARTRDGVRLSDHPIVEAEFEFA